MTVSWVFGPVLDSLNGLSSFHQFSFSTGRVGCRPRGFKELGLSPRVKGQDLNLGGSVPHRHVDVWSAALARELRARRKGIGDLFEETRACKWLAVGRELRGNCSELWG